MRKQWFCTFQQVLWLQNHWFYMQRQWFYMQKYWFYMQKYWFLRSSRCSGEQSSELRAEAVLLHLDTANEYSFILQEKEL